MNEHSNLGCWLGARKVLISDYDEFACGFDAYVAKLDAIRVMYECECAEEAATGQKMYEKWRAAAVAEREGTP